MLRRLVWPRICPFSEMIKNFSYTMNQLLAFFLLLYIPNCLIAQAKLHFPITVINIDTLIEGELHTVKFPFQNSGTDTLRLTGVHSSCGCTIPSWQAHNLLSGQWDTILATYNSVGHLGNIGKFVYIESNGGKSDVKIDGMVIPFSTDMRIYYGSGGKLIQYHVKKTKTESHLFFDIKKDELGKYSGDISLVISNSALLPKVLSIDQAEMEAKGINIKVLKQAGMAITYVQPYNALLENKSSYIYRFSFQNFENTSLNLLLDKEEIKIYFAFEK